MQDENGCACEHCVALRELIAMVRGSSGSASAELASLMSLDSPRVSDLPYEQRLEIAKKICPEFFVADVNQARSELKDIKELDQAALDLAEKEYWRDNGDARHNLATAILTYLNAS